MANSNVLLDRNTHIGQNVCGTCYEGRITLPGRNESAPSGVTISNSLFSGGNSDGIQNGSNGTRIIGNEITGVVQNSAAHSDSIQLYGSKNTLVKGNYIHDVPTGIMSGDGTDHETIEDNVIVNTTLGGGYASVVLGPDDGSIVRHNTFDSQIRVCSSMGANSCNAPSRPSVGTVLKDNVIDQLWVNGTSVSFAEENYNLFGSISAPSGFTRGAQDIIGQPTFVDGANPTTYGGFRLAAGSLGKGNASDGLDRGIR